MKAQFELPVQYKKHRLMLRVVPTGLELWPKYSREAPIFFPWWKVVKSLTGWGVAELPRKLQP